MKKVLIVVVCLTLVLTLVFTLGALGKKPGKPEYQVTLTGKGVKGDIQLGVQGRFLCSSPINRPIELTLSEIFRTSISGVDYSGKCDGLYLDLSKKKVEITMQYFFNDDNGEKVQLNVYGGDLVEGEWLSEEEEGFTIVFDDSDNAVILSTKGKRGPLWGPGSVNITVVCVPQE